MDKNKWLLHLGVLVLAVLFLVFTVILDTEPPSVQWYAYKVVTVLLAIPVLYLVQKIQNQEGSLDRLGGREIMLMDLVKWSMIFVLLMVPLLLTMGQKYGIVDSALYLASAGSEMFVVLAGVIPG